MFTTSYYLFFIDVVNVAFLNYFRVVNNKWLVTGFQRGGGSTPPPHIPLVFALIVRVVITYHFCPRKSALNEIFWSQLISEVSPQNLVNDNEVIYGF